MSGNAAIGSTSAKGIRRGLRTWLRGWVNPEVRAHGIQATETIPTVAPSRSEGPLRLLVVDDVPLNLRVTSGLLESRGIVPVVAADGAEAVALACGLHFDLILMDLQMPVLDGLGATAAIRNFESSSPRPPVPVVAYTGLYPGPLVLAAHGLSGYLNKPCHDDELEDCLVRWCPTYRPVPSRQGATGHSAWYQVIRSSGASGSSLR